MLHSMVNQGRLTLNKPPVVSNLFNLSHMDFLVKMCFKMSLHWSNTISCAYFKHTKLLLSGLSKFMTMQIRRRFIPMLFLLV